MIRAILLDLGGPVFNEDAEYRHWTILLCEELGKYGVRVSPEAFEAKLAEEIARCEPNPWLSTVWRFVNPDRTRFKAILSAFLAHDKEFQKELPGVFVRPEAKEVIPRLAERYPLALAANQPARALELLENEGLLAHFRWREVSETIGLAKPSLLFFRMILDSLGVKPEEAAMVGDRLDHDIFPAKLLGMKTVRVLVGPYRRQRPLTPLHSPHLTFSDLLELERALKVQV